MFSTEEFLNFILMRRNTKESNEQDQGYYDDPHEDTCMFLSMQWVRLHIKTLLFIILTITSIAVAVLASLLAWSYVSKGYNIVPIRNHKPNEINFYTPEEQEFHIPEKSSGLDGDMSNSVSSNFVGLDQFERPYFANTKDDQISFEEQTDENAVSHDEIYHHTNPDENTIENASPDEYREHLHAKHLHPKSHYHEENADTRETNVDFVELHATTVPVTNKKSYHEPPGNPKPTLSNQESTSPSSSSADVSSEHIATATETKHTNEGSDSPMQLHRVENAVKAGAVCLDGSAPAYYHRRGSGNSKKLWIIHFNGGAWCFDAKACFERSLSSLGSTKKLPPSPPIIQGINSPDPIVNPDFYDWNLVWVVYCDGASFTGNRERPLISDTGQTIYMRGKRVINAIINDLLYNRDFKLAEAIILTGSSAGSMTAMFQADYIASKFPKTIPVRVLSDAGFFIDTAPIGGKNLGAMFKRIYELQNSSAGLNQDCVRDVGLDDAWQCFLPAKSTKYTKTPMFVLNSAYDIWALIYFLDIDCKYPTQEQKQRKKRHVFQQMFVRSDSELQVSFKSDDTTDWNLFAKRKRDVSGFEITPFFRRISITKDDIPAELPDNSDFEKDDPQKGDSVNSNVNSSSTVGEEDYKSDKKPSTKEKKLISLLKNLGSITTDNDMNVLFHEIHSDGSTRNQSNEKLNDPKNENITDGTANNNTAKKGEIFSVLLKNRTETTDDSEQEKPTSKPVILRSRVNQTDTTEDSEQEKPTLKTFNPPSEESRPGTSENSEKERPASKSVIHPSGENRPGTSEDSGQEIPTSKSIIPPSEENRLAELKQNFAEDLKHFPPKKSVLQRLDERRKQSRETLIGQSRHNINITLIDKRQRLNKDKNALKSRRSTSIAREYINILRSDPPECTEKDILNSMKYRGQLLKATDPLTHMPKSGRFLVSCIDHSLSLFDETWSGLSIKGKSIQQAFGDWFYERGSKLNHNLVDCPYPCNPSCP